jgi:AraC family transcriptional regulator of adaptative response/methylated-DNA-[protein]-cysteine methyltransferase
MRKKSEDLSMLRQWLLEAEFLPIIELARTRKRILSLLTALTYDKDSIVSDRAIQATGLAAKTIAERDPEYIRIYLLRLFWLINDESGGVCWRAPELIGEILYNCPSYEQFFPMLISLLDLEKEDAPRFRSGTLWAIGRVAQIRRDAMWPALPQIQKYISSEEEPDTKEMAIWCLKQLTVGELQ